MSFTHFLLQVSPALIAVRVERRLRASAYGGGDHYQLRACWSAPAPPSHLWLWPMSSAVLTAASGLPHMGQTGIFKMVLQICPWGRHSIKTSSRGGRDNSGVAWWASLHHRPELQGPPRVPGRRGCEGDAKWQVPKQRLGRVPEDQLWIALRCFRHRPHQ